MCAGAGACTCMVRCRWASRASIAHTPVSFIILTFSFFPSPLLCLLKEPLPHRLVPAWENMNLCRLPPRGDDLRRLLPLFPAPRDTGLLRAHSRSQNKRKEGGWVSWPCPNCRPEWARYEALPWAPPAICMQSRPPSSAVSLLCHHPLSIRQRCGCPSSVSESPLRNHVLVPLPPRPLAPQLSELAGEFFSRTEESP